jgi:hypothetical protein
MPTLIAILTVLGATPGSHDALAPWGTNHCPTDVPKRHVEEIAASWHVYVIRHGGTGNIPNALVVGAQIGINF